MKKPTRIILLITTLCLCLCSCIGKSTENPLADKEYEAMVISTDVPFEELWKELYIEYSSHILTLSDYLLLHGDEIETGGGFSNFDDFEQKFDGYYRFLYKVIYCESDNVPENYTDAWQYLKTTAWTNKSDLNELYLLKGQELMTGISDMLSRVQAGLMLAAQEVPAAQEVVSNQQPNAIVLGDMISLDFVEMSIEEINISDELYPPVTAGGYTYQSDIVNEKFFCLTGVLKNLSESSYDIQHMYAEMKFDNKYTYTAYIQASAWDNHLSGEYVKPLGEVKYYIHSSVPDELIDSFSTCTISFGFNDDFSGSRHMSSTECNYVYSLNVGNDVAQQ